MQKNVKIAQKQGKLRFMASLGPYKMKNVSVLNPKD